MTIKTILRASEKFIVDNSPGILTGLAVAGTVTTAILTGRAAYSSALRIKAEELVFAGGQVVGSGDPLLPKEKFQLVWKNFIPPAVMGVVTITSVIMANQIGSRRAAALAAAFKISEELSEEYKERVTKALGKKKEEEVRAELASDRINRIPESGLIVVAGSETVFFDELSGRVFQADMDRVKKAVNDINHKVNNYYHASVSDFYDELGLPHTQFSDDFGWNSDELLNVTYTATMYQEGKVAVAISYNHKPIHGYDRCQ